MSTTPTPAQPPAQPSVRTPPRSGAGASRPARRRNRVRNPRVLVPLLAAGVLALAVGLPLFQPWRLFTSTTVVEAPPVPAPDVTTATELAGRFLSHEHATTGAARLIRLPDGTAVVRLEGLDTSDGPDLHVWLTDQPVRTGTAGWRVFDDGRYVDLGPLKGNVGDQNYPVPPGTDLDGLTSVSVWCARFRVSFGAAALAPAG